MNHQIKFRVVDVTNPEKEVIIGHERVNQNGEWESMRVNRKTWLLGCITMGQESRKFERRQFTGITDGKGNEIYVGMSLEYYHMQAELHLSGTVIFHEGCFSLLVEVLYNKNTGWDTGSKPPLSDFDYRGLIIV